MLIGSFITLMGRIALLYLSTLSTYLFVTILIRRMLELCETGFYNTLYRRKEEVAYFLKGVIWYDCNP